MKQLNYLLYCWLFVLITTVSHAQGYEKLTLQQAIDLALNQNRNIQSRLLDEKSMVYERKDALSPAYPQIKGTLSFQHNIQQPVSFVPASAFGGPDGVFNQFPQGLKNNSSAGIEATQLLYNQALFDGLKAIEVSKDLTKLQTEKEKQDLSNQITSVYFGIYIQAQQVEIVKSNIETIQKTLRISELNYKNGLIRQLDYERIVVNKGNLETQLKNLLMSYNQQLNTLKFLMNLPLDSPVTLASELDNIPEFSQQQGEDLTGKRFDFLLIQKQIELNKTQLRVTRAGYFPSAQAFWNYSYNWSNPEFSKLYTSNINYQAMSVGLRVSVPIFDGMEKASKISKTRIKEEQLGLQKQTLEENIKLQTLNAVERWKVSQEALTNQKTNKELAEKIYRQSAMEFEQGLASLNDLLQSETTVKEAQSKYIEAMSNVLLAIVEWKKATGN